MEQVEQRVNNTGRDNSFVSSRAPPGDNKDFPGVGRSLLRCCSRQDDDEVHFAIYENNNGRIICSLPEVILATPGTYTLSNLS